MKNIKNSNNPQKTEKTESVNLNDNHNKGKKNTEKIDLYKEWMKYKEANK